MDKVKFLKDFSIAWDGINTTEYKQGEVYDLEPAKLERLINAGVVELTTKKVVKPEITKIVEPKEKKILKKKLNK